MNTHISKEMIQIFRIDFIDSSGELKSIELSPALESKELFRVSTKGNRGTLKSTTFTSNELGSLAELLEYAGFISIPEEA